MNELWVEKYRPSQIKDCVLPEELKKTFQEFVKKNYIPNLLLTGGPGVGKTTVARAMLEECNFDYIVINGSMNGNIDTLRTEIQSFASTVSMTAARKYVILDEAQNCTFEQIRMFLTRIGQDSKMVINGDIEQTDLYSEENALYKCIERLEGVKGLSICELTEQDIVRNSIISRILSRLK